MRNSHFSGGKHLEMESRFAHLDALESQSIYILREAYRKFKRLALLWSIGKDSSVMLWLLRKAFFGHIPVPCVHVDTSYKIPEMIAFRDRLLEGGGGKHLCGENWGGAGARRMLQSAQEGCSTGDY